MARLDDDARDDLVIADNAQVTVLLGQSSGALVRVAAYPVARPVQLAAGDLDGDRHTDLVVIGQEVEAHEREHGAEAGADEAAVVRTQPRLVGGALRGERRGVVRVGLPRGAAPEELHHHDGGQ